MKTSFIFAFIACAISLAAAETIVCMYSPQEPSCDDLGTLQSVVVQHYGDDYQAGDQLYDQIKEILNDSNACRREIVLKCKHAGCKFFLSGTVNLDFTDLNGGLKIRGLLKEGRRPIIWQTGQIRITTTGGINGVDARSIVEFEKINFQADGFSSSLTNILILGSTVEQTNVSTTITFDECDFIGHSAGFSNGGAVNIASANKGTVFNFSTCRFINNSAKVGGALYIGPSLASYDCVMIFIKDCMFTDNAAIEKGGAIASIFSEVYVLGTHFTGNTANKKGDNFVGEGGAIYVEYGKMIIRDARTHGGNSAQFGNFAFGTDNAVLEVEGFGCYEGPFANLYTEAERHTDYSNHAYDSYHRYPVCSANSYDSYAPREDIYVQNDTLVKLTRVDLPGGVICDEDSTQSTVERFGCGSYVQTYHCQFAANDKPIEAEDYDRDGFDCRYDCNDLWKTVNPAAPEQCNGTTGTTGDDMISYIDLVELKNPRNYVVRWLDGDSNCNGLVDEFIDSDGDWVPDDVDRCPFDYWKITPGMCGCGLEETDGCAGGSVDPEGECQTTEYQGVWYFTCVSDWWWWSGEEWTYGGSQ